MRAMLLIPGTEPVPVEIVGWVTRNTVVEAVVLRDGLFSTAALRDLRGVESDPTIIRQPGSPLGAATGARKGRAKG